MKPRPLLGRTLLLSLCAVLPLCLWLALANGAIALSPSAVSQGLWATLRAQHDSQTALIVGQLRLPRVLLSAWVGAILGISGAAMQGLFRNPLADPSLIGVTAGASLGASLAIVGVAAGGPPLLGLGIISTGAFIGGLLTVILVYSLATSSSGTSVATMLLAGIAITALAGSIGNLLEYYADNEMLRRISLWRMGGLDGANYPKLLLASIIGISLLWVLPRYAQALNALLLGESEARHLGIDVDRLKLQLIFWVAIAVGLSVALAGTIAFVGLIVPHLVRLLIGPDHRYLLVCSALAGAILLTLADTLARVILAPAELPVGIVTAMLGVPFFIFLLRAQHSSRGDIA